ncbi:quinone-dependent dihydroorotate dehydrogenase [Waterburya agarophytonicola K14]|uniref:Dihydroorotate dehydrogenase (quinone) n=1 Tax=Waterburya agarophytonicola KI4 TaxID=2874699 RepID=A0A964FLK1_9CYAN|nr:quinone-dependent dihydroorotate dehydrogenase [Waterburya agarophytonicola]MCC0179428.1 quinone-dependent dihydroorotate dehydrogenase [Waterburya agarophytonicola KI4]
MLNFTKPLYPLLLSSVKSDPETAHRQMLKTLSNLEINRHSVWGNLAIKQLEKSFCIRDSRLQQTLWGLNFNNPFGLAAGFDKDGTAAGMWSSFGFGFAELGAVTLHSQSGNPRPRMFRLPEDKAALNRMGANNLGAAVMADTLAQTWRRQPRKIPIGINLCKSKIAALEEATADYVGSFQYLQDVADYFVINVSSPNTPGLRSLQGGEQLEPILSGLQTANTNSKPILIKIAPDLEWEDIKDILNLATSYNLSGVIATNTTISRDRLNTKILKETGKSIQDEAGGISGFPVKERSTEVIRFIYQETGGKLPIIGVGGIFNAEDAWAKIIAGASVLQVYTGWVYEGPWMVNNVLSGLLAKLDEKGLDNIKDAVGLEH